MGWIGTHFRRLVKSFAGARGGNVAMMAGIALPILLMASAGAIDLHNVARVKTELQDALDAASLAAARSSATAPGQIQSIGMASLRANMPKYFHNNPGDVAVFTIVGRDRVTATATVQVKTIVANIFLPPYGSLFDDYIPMSATSDVLRASRNVEVAIALDITGSMATPVNYMPDLKAAAKELANIVVQGDQQVFTTRVALVPYAAGVNVGTYADAFRNSLIGAKTVTAIGWARGTNITPNARVSSGTFTASNHGLSVGQHVYVSGTGESTLNDKVWEVSAATATTFKLRNYNSSVSSLGSNRKVQACLYANCYTGITAAGHSVATGDYVELTTVTTALNSVHQATRINDNLFTVPVVGATAGTYSGTRGRAQCGGDGCAVRHFISASTRYPLQELPSSNCVSERPRGSAAPSDAPPSASRPLGRAYLASSNSCPTAAYAPLSNTLSTIERQIDSYAAKGSTAGQVGIEMAWYSISPTFGDVFPVASRPNAFDTSRTVKAVVLMTDGEFNTPFCQGVIAKDAGTGSGDAETHINCDATNGDGFAQSVQICQAMRAQGIVVYTVGFNLGTGRGRAGIDTAYEVMETCATSSEHFFPAATGTDLKEAFKSIGRDITRLRIAR